MTAVATTPTSTPSPPTSHQNTWLTRFALGALIGNVLIVLTGGAVRLTASGLGCPTWPTCTEESYTNTPELGIHGYIEFGNRLLGFVLSALVGLAIIAAWRIRSQRPGLFKLALLQLGGVIAQAIIGGITVLTGLNPWTVAAHFLVSILLISAAYLLWARSRPEPNNWITPAPLRALSWVLLGLTFIAIAIGTIVTGSGPHSGDEAATRTGFDPESISQLHADSVFALLGLSLAMPFALKLAKAPAHINRAVLLLLLAEVVQGAIGAVQYFTGLPVLAVAMHMLGACLVWLAAVHLVGSITGLSQPAPTTLPTSATPR
ncbi:MAG: heme A synthase [Corynebacteriales bacterium]|nr:heme A synthase [Mycobacteriales bacterium]